MINPRLVKIRVYPIKSLGPVDVNSTSISKHGKLQYDRSYALFEGSGDIIKAKSDTSIHQLQADINLGTLNGYFRFHENPKEEKFHLEKDRVKIGDWLTQQFQRPIKLQSDETLGFADDWTATGPTLVSTATLHEISSWYENISVEEIRVRLRANLEIDGVPAFWEDQLYASSEDNLVKFTIGDVELLGKNSCQRCPVPTRDSQTGESMPGFAKTFTTQRKATLQPWAHPSRFNHFYRVAINTIPGDIHAGSILKVGDKLQIKEEISTNSIT